MITIIDYGLGNLSSVRNMIKKIGFESILSSDISAIKEADKLILPGVGSFGRGMENIFEKNLFEVINYKVVKQKTPILGICLGMQLMTKFSEESNTAGFGWFDAETIRFEKSKLPFDLKIPHMGWSDIFVKRNKIFFSGKKEKLRFYFAHSYHVKCNDYKDVSATAEYGYEFPCVISKKNIIGVQFHPEKSHKFGMQVLKNFIKDFN